MQAWGLTDPGCVRVQNQDAFQIRPFGEDSVLCAVCDGMGGAKSGNVASSLALDVFIQEVDRLRKPGMTQEQAGQMFRDAVGLANATVYDQQGCQSDSRNICLPPSDWQSAWKECDGIPAPAAGREAPWAFGSEYPPWHTGT